jgi:hypothetical protein
VENLTRSTVAEFGVQRFSAADFILHEAAVTAARVQRAERSVGFVRRLGFPGFVRRGGIGGGLTCFGAWRWHIEMRGLGLSVLDSDHGKDWCGGDAL